MVLATVNGENEGLMGEMGAINNGRVMMGG